MSTRRTIRRSLLSAAATAMMVAVPATTAGAAATTHASVFKGSRISATTSDSLNWAGYAVTPATGITAVDSTFTVPTASNVPPGFSATWTGIGGYTSSDLIQAGVSENNSLTTAVTGPQYYAWYEILPASETQITGCTGDANCTVSPGDTVSVDIHNTGGNQWSVSLTDSGHWTYNISLTYASTESSAEWIQEAPTLVVQTIPDGVGTVHFGGTSTFTENGTTYTIGSSPTAATQIEESPIGVVNEATVSNLGTDGQSFNVCVYAQSCAAP